MKKEMKQLLLATKMVLVLLWPVSAWAATIAFGEELSKIPMLSLLMTVVLSTVMGTTALLHAMKVEYEKSDEIARLGLFVASKLFGANAAGLLMFFGAESWDIPTSYKAFCIMVAAFGGTWFIERVLNHFTNQLAPEAK